MFHGNRDSTLNINFCSRYIRENTSQPSPPHMGHFYHVLAKNVIWQEVEWPHHFGTDCWLCFIHLTAWSKTNEILSYCVYVYWILLYSQLHKFITSDLIIADSILHLIPVPVERKVQIGAGCLTWASYSCSCCWHFLSSCLTLALCVSSSCCSVWLDHTHHMTTSHCTHLHVCSQRTASNYSIETSF